MSAKNASNLTQRKRQDATPYSQCNNSKSKSTSIENVPLNGLTPANSVAENYNEAIQRTELWTPFFLSKLALVEFGFSFVAVAVVLSLLYAYSVRNQGLATTDESMHYLWTYGPTAGEIGIYLTRRHKCYFMSLVLTLLAALWGQVEFNRLMRGESQCAE